MTHTYNFGDQVLVQLPPGCDLIGHCGWPDYLVRGRVELPSRSDGLVAVSIDVGDLQLAPRWLRAEWVSPYPPLKEKPPCADCKGTGILELFTSKGPCPACRP